MYTFNHIQGQENAKQLVTGLLKGERPIHALLFEGPSGIGKQTTAFVTAAAHLCDTPSDDPCGACSACRKVQSGTHPGLFLIDPESVEEDELHPTAVQTDIIPSKLEDSSGTGTIGIDPVRTLRQELALKPSSHQKRAIILGDFDQATVEAQNALLKTLEEPPDGTLLICTAETRAGLVKTIVSRCQRIRFGPLQIETTTDIIREQSDCSEEEASFLSRISGGRPGVALQYLSSDVQEVQKWFRDLLNKYGVKKDPRFRKELLNGLRNQNGGDRQEMLDTIFLLLETFFRDAMHHHSNTSDDYKHFYPPSLLQRYLQRTSWQELLKAARRLDTLKSGQEVYIHYTVLVENILI